MLHLKMAPVKGIFRFHVGSWVSVTYWGREGVIQKIPKRVFTVGNLTFRELSNFRVFIFIQAVFSMIHWIFVTPILGEMLQVHIFQVAWRVIPG